MHEEKQVCIFGCNHNIIFLLWLNKLGIDDVYGSNLIISTG